VDIAELCVPKFFHSDCFLLDPVAHLHAFDRIYCGATVSNEHLQLFQAFLTLGGVMVVPNDEQVGFLACFLLL